MAVFKRYTLIPLYTHVSNCWWRRTYKNNSFLLTQFGKFHVFWEKAISWMDSLEGRNEQISFLVPHWQTAAQVMASPSGEAPPCAMDRYIWSLSEHVSKETSELYFSNIFLIEAYLIYNWIFILKFWSLTWNRKAIFLFMVVISYQIYHFNHFQCIVQWR